MSRVRTLIGKNPVTAWICLGIPFIIVVGSLMHFVFEWSGNATIVGIFAPVNESVWEHLKMGFWPMLVWWFAGYFIYGNNNKHFATQWFSSCAVALVVCPLVVMFLFYTYTSAFGIEVLLLDILAFIIGVIAAQWIALHVYQCANFSSYCLYVSFAIFILMMLFFAVFTFIPPHIPLFLDFSTGKYGI